MKQTDSYKNIYDIVKHICGLADDYLPFYSEFVEGVAYGRVTDINQIEHYLDSMLAYCFDDRILSLFKKVLRNLYKRFPDTVQAYVKFYYEMYEEKVGVAE
jgi:hypothetical protein